MQTPHSGFFYIQQVAEITELSKQLIRKWEDRYEIIHPTRLDNGYRVYSEQDVNILLTVKSLIEQGHTVKQAATLLKDGIVQPLTEQNAANVDYAAETNLYVRQLLQKGSQCKEAELNQLLHQTYHLFGLKEFLNSVIVPFLKEVGNRWETGEWSEYQEALSSTLVRDFLVQIRRNFQINQDAPLVVGACLPSEHHEVPVHILLLEAMVRGWKTFFIGFSPAPGSIQAIVERLNPKKVILSASTLLPFQHYPTLLEELDEFARKHPETEFYLGGTGSMLYCDDLAPKHLKLTNDINEVFR
ncbi:MerR family transcriptional regulator [Lysinibacillus yapensis]|uniref:MerR family transcriptional regulator n=1 Tax=Ureibacillus yapensis TaxID=2304605 RepID=A0A396S4U9_9BACL|nr:MerR family transcriptional regulator [Lysinibacillus yapensis]RHW34716.1 MerR family transcriptional regulator [Lysinibacillus yapensis]